ncbi:MAG: hypothetical protein ACHP83_13045, partial [Burkholderiales bacterium]
MSTLSTFASTAADLTAGWKPQGEADEVDLAEARVALERTLQAGKTPAAVSRLAGKTAAVVPGPVEQQSLAHDLQAARPLALLRSLPEAQGLARTVPPWAHGMATSTSLGPFVDAVGVPHWVDLITVRKTFSVVRGPAATPLCVLQLELHVFAPVVAPLAEASSPSAAPVAPALPVAHATFGPGSLWLVVRAFDATAPADAFGGLAFQSGRVTISGAYSLSGSVITLSPTATLLIELVPLPAPAPGAGTGGGADFRNAVLTLPVAVSFRFAAAGNSLSAMADASLTAYGSTQQFSYQAAAATYNAALALLVFPCVVQPAAFGVSSSASPIFTVAGSAAVLGGAYALPVAVTTPGSLGAAAAGGYLSLVTAGPLSVALAGASAPAPLAGAVLLSTPSTLLVFVQSVTADEQRYELWDGRQARPSSLQARVAAGATLVFVSSAHSEFTLEDAAIDALLDRPVAANGDTLTVSFASALVAVLFTHSPATLLVFAAQAPTNALFPLVLDNAWLRVGQATVFELYGRLQGSRVIRGALSLAMPLVDLLPTLPDPYLARYIGQQREGGIAGIGAGGADAVATVQWATPATPRLLFAMLPLPAAAGASGSAPPLLGDALAGTPRSSVQGLAELLDVSTNADLLGVFIYESAAALGFEGISLVAQLDQLLLFAVPQISWEPLLTPGANWGFVSPDDGTAAFMFVQSAQPVRIAPGLLFDLEVKQAGAARTVGTFTLPFGIDATLDTSISGGTNPPLPSFGAMQPQFPGQQGARQLAISAGNLPANDAALTGSANATPS